MFEAPPADMSEAPPPGAASDNGRHHFGRHGSGGTAYADDAPAAASLPGTAPSENGDMGRGAGSVSIGSGQGEDITPRPATPDTQVSYGPNGR